MKKQIFTGNAIVAITCTGLVAESLFAPTKAQTYKYTAQPTGRSKTRSVVEVRQQ